MQHLCSQPAAAVAQAAAGAVVLTAAADWACTKADAREPSIPPRAGAQVGESLEEQLGQRLLRMPPPVIPPRGRATSTSGPNIDPAAAGASPSGAAGQPWTGLPAEPPPAGFNSSGGGLPASGDGGGVGPGAWANRLPPSSSTAPDDWEIDISQLHIDSKVAAGARRGRAVDGGGRWPAAAAAAAAVRAGAAGAQAERHSCAGVSALSRRSPRLPRRLVQQPV